jgi:DNA-binding NarL/FixJ family response regulator
MARKFRGSNLPTPRRIFIVDDHPLVRRGLSAILDRKPLHVVCGEAPDRLEALDKIEKLKPDLVTVDLCLRNSHGLDLIKDARIRFPSVLTLVCSEHDDVLNAKRAVGAGAHGFVSKYDPMSEVLLAVEQIFAGEIYVSHRVTSQLALQMVGRVRVDQAPTIQNLTDREMQVYELTGDGLTARQIAGRLNLSISTIETYRNRLREKLGLANSVDLLQAAIRWNRGGELSSRSVPPPGQTPQLASRSDELRPSAA